MCENGKVNTVLAKGQIFPLIFRSLLKILILNHLLLSLRDCSLRMNYGLHLQTLSWIAENLTRLVKDKKIRHIRKTHHSALLRDVFLCVQV